MVVSIEKLVLKDVTISKSRKISYQKTELCCLMPKVPMASSLTIFSGSPSRGSFTLDLTSSSQTINVLERLDDWILRVAKKLQWFDEEDLDEMYTSLVHRDENGRVTLRVGFPIWGDSPSIEVYNQDQQLMDFPLSELDALSTVRVVLHFQGIWLSNRGFGWNLQPVQVMIFNEDELPQDCLIEEDDVNPTQLDAEHQGVNAENVHESSTPTTKNDDHIPCLIDEYDDGEDDDL